MEKLNSYIVGKCARDVSACMLYAKFESLITSTQKKKSHLLDFNEHLTFFRYKTRDRPVLILNRITNYLFHFRKFMDGLLPVVLYGCEAWSLTLREERKLRVLENMVLRRIFGSRWDEKTWNGGECKTKSSLICIPKQILCG